MSFARILAIVALLLAALPGVAAAETGDPSMPGQIAGWQKVLHRSESVLARQGLSEAEFGELQQALTGLITEARAAAAAVATTADSTRQMVEALGPVPEEGEEAAPVARERKQLNARIAEYQGQAKQAELVATRADILLRTANERRLEQFTETLLRRGPSPVLPSTWAELPDQLPFLRDRFVGAFEAARRTVSDEDGVGFKLGQLGVIALLSFGVALPLRRWLLRRHGHRPTAVGPGYRRRAAATVVEAFARALIPVVLTVAVAVWVRAVLGDQPTRILPTLATGTAGGLVFFFLCSGLSHAVLAPEHPAWRLASLTEDSARHLGRRIVAFAALLAASGAVAVGLASLLMPPEFAAVAGFAALVVGAGALLSLLPNGLWRREAAPAAAPCADPAAGEDAVVAPPTAWPRLRLAAGLTAVAVVVAAAAGYRTLALYVAEMALLGTAVAGVLLVVRGVVLELMQLMLCRPRSPLAELRRTLFPTERGGKLCDYVARTLLDLGLMVAGAATLLPLTGIQWSELRGWTNAFMRGVEVGGIRVSPGDILAAVMVVVVGVLLTRFAQRKIDERVLQRLELDRGVQHSIRIGVGYLGVMIAILLGIGALGLDLSSLALIAGALSVGIGFGLQNVVSNFVSGLILLVERPIKVGDWVIVGDKEGVVRRISVRATEIQTFQRASVVIPNSELVSTAVVNWTLKDKFGRIDLRLRVAYDSDLELVRETLLRCAAGHALVCRVPAPVVVFRDFGPSALDFELRCFVSDVDNYLSVASDLRFAIAAAFREAGIVIPFPQQVTHVPQLDGLRDLMAGREAAPQRPQAPAEVMSLASASAGAS